MRVCVLKRSNFKFSIIVVIIVAFIIVSILWYYRSIMETWVSQLPELFWIGTQRVESGLKELSSHLMLRSPPTDWLTIFFELANNATDLLINFYLVNPRTFFAILLCLCYVIYYIRNVVHKPMFICAEGRFKWFIKANCPIVNDNYWPTLWCYETHLLTPISNFLRSLIPELKYHREILSTSDGGQISLDWYDPDGSETKTVYRQTSLDNQEQTLSKHSMSERSVENNKPIALFLPGLAGSSQAEYIKSLVPIAHRIGYRVVVINYRGLGNTPLLTPRMYCAADDADLCTALVHLREANPKEKIIAVGISLGGIILARYLIRSGYHSLVDAAFMVSVCWDIMEGIASMEKGLNFALNQHLTRSLVSIVEANREIFQKLPNIDIDAVSKCRNQREFDEKFTIRMFNFESVSHYYCESSHKGKIACIKTPTFCINAADDMFMPLEYLPLDEVLQSRNVAMLVTQRGGHIGFMDGFIPNFKCEFYSERVIEQYLKALYQLTDIKRDLLL
ncbi:protein ABHD1 [Dermatophagoides farinae]|uniref:protein ABHD1 n=1 Tax=Dermatophagoides farinae TaxID=6954 RepID=UPI003F5EE654